MNTSYVEEMCLCFYIACYAYAIAVLMQMILKSKACAVYM
jgi:hypothetical protein